jgi:hypothetical protein
VEEINYLVKNIPAVLSCHQQLQAGNFLFSGYSFYLFGEFSNPSKAEIEMLIKAGKGTLLSSLPPPASTPLEVGIISFF